MFKKNKKAYRVKLDCNRSKIVGWPKSSHAPEKKGFWQTVRALLF